MSYLTKAALASGTCPHCGQPMPTVRLGVRMYPQTARVFDIIHRAGRDGIEGHALFERAYAGMRKPQYRTIKAHVAHIREALADTSFSIEVARGRYPTYRLVKLVKLKAFEYGYSDEN